MAPEPPLGAAAIAHYFELILGRPPESPAVVAHYERMGLSAAAFVRVLMDSEEVTERYRRRIALAALSEGPTGEPVPAPGDPPRVLLFGAYGNGNLGDAAQAEAVAFLLRRMLPMPLDLAACSWERRAPFAFADGSTLPPDVLLRRELLPRTGRGLVVIGGGGLLGAPHFPLHAGRWADWFAARRIPWALLGVGGSAEALNEPAWASAYRTLLSGAAFLGMRDASTLAAARSVSPKAAWFPDPVLARALLADTVPAGAESTLARPIEALLIPRHPNNPADAAANHALLAWRDRQVGLGRRVVVAALERELDAGAVGPGEVAYLDDWGALMDLCGQARLVVSMRLHGAIAGLAAGCVVQGLVQPKIGDLMRSLGIGAWFAPGAPFPEPDASAEDIAAFRGAMREPLERMRTELAHALASAGRQLAAALAPLPAPQ